MNTEKHIPVLTVEGTSEWEQFKIKRQKYIVRLVAERFPGRQYFYDTVKLSHSLGKKFLDEGPECLSYSQAVRVATALDLNLYDFLPNEGGPPVNRYLSTAIMELYSQLNQEGRARITNYLQDLVSSKRYVNVQYRYKKDTDNEKYDNIDVSAPLIEDLPKYISCGRTAYLTSLLEFPNDKKTLFEIREIEKILLERIESRRKVMVTETKLQESSEPESEELVKIFREQMMETNRLLVEEKRQLKKLIKYRMAENSILNEQIVNLRKVNFNLYHKFYQSKQKGSNKNEEDILLISDSLEDFKNTKEEIRNKIEKKSIDNADTILMNKLIKSAEGGTNGTQS